MEKLKSTHTGVNPFQCDYEVRLREWKHLRLLSHTQHLSDVCVSVDRWWQQAPLVNHYLHPHDIQNWPDPWTLLSENTYCVLTRAVGMCYTLLMSEIWDIELVRAVDCQCEEHYLVCVGREKYIMNYWPDSVLNTHLTEFTIKKTIDLDTLKQKLQ